MLDRDKFAKVLARAESDHDAEALTAVRLAAKLARGAGMTLGQAVEAGGRFPPAGPSLEVCLRRAEARIRELEAAQTRFDPDAWMRAFEAGKKAGAAEAFAPMEHERSGFQRRIDALEAELEQYRPPLDWPALARAYTEAGKRWGSAKAKAIAGRAKRGELTVEDKITLRHFVEKNSKNNCL